MSNNNVCHNLKGKEKRQCLNRERIKQEGKECSQAFLRVGCDKRSRFWMTFIINAIINVFFIVIMVQLYLDNTASLYVGNSHVVYP